MMPDKLTIAGVDVRKARVLMRADFNVPLKGIGEIADDTRIRAALPTMNHLLQAGGSLVLMSHLGRPKGKPNPEFSLRPVADHLAELMPSPVKFATDSVGPSATQLAAGLLPGEILLLENLRFNPGETENDPGFAAGLAQLGQLYVNDAFGTAHRAHASTVGVTRHFPIRAAGFLMERELQQMGRLLHDPPRPFVAVLGGAKVQGKVDVMLNLLDQVDTLVLGGGMIFTFFKVLGLEVGDSLVEEESLAVVKEIMDRSQSSRARLVLPEDCVVSSDFSESGDRKEVLITDIPEKWQGLDIGSKTTERYTEILATARAVFWNGPMGVFEMPAFAAGTRAVGEAIGTATTAGAISVVGGGDSVAAINQLGLADRITHISTGGGASLEYMAGRTLPGVAALTDAGNLNGSGHN